MKFSYDRAWQDAQWLWRAHGEYVSILAGLFIMVPIFAWLLFIPLPAPASGEVTMAMVETYFRENRWALMLVNLVTLIGSASIYGLMLDVRRPTVGQAIRVAVFMLPGIFLLQLIFQFAIFGGLSLFIVPGIYLVGRLAVAMPWQMAHRSINPLTAIVRSFELTRGSAWVIAGLVLMVFVVGWIAVMAAALMVGIVIALIIPETSQAAVDAFASAILLTLFLLALIMALAAICQQLDRGDSRQS